MRPVAIAGFASLVLLTAATAVSASTISVNGVIRDFKRGDQAGGHPDFETFLGGGDPGIVQTALGVDGKPVYTGLAGNPSTTGATNFNQWFNDTPGVNLSTPLSITLNDDGLAGDATANDGLFTYENFAFFPIDNQSFGNQGLSHNYGFTYELHTTFTFVPGQTFTFLGDDDLWVFINGQLVIDLGGVHPQQTGSVSLSSLGLTAGNGYNLDLFFAERHTTESNFRVTTNIPLVVNPNATVPEPTSVLLLGTGAVALFAKRLRRRSVS